MTYPPITEEKLQELEETLAPFLDMLKVETMSNGHGLHFAGTRPDDASFQWDWNLSLAKWVKLVRECQSGKVVRGGGAHTCGLCMRFFNDWCDECPITNQGDEYPKCVGTPQSRYVSELSDEPNPEALLHHAMDELAFLLDLHQQWRTSEGFVRRTSQGFIRRQSNE
jgi:hypothetical protein